MHLPIPRWALATRLQELTSSSRKILTGTACLCLATASIWFGGKSLNPSSKNLVPRVECMREEWLSECTELQEGVGVIPAGSATDPKAANSLSDTVHFQRTSEREADTIPLLQKAVEQDNARAGLWNNLAVAHLDKGSRQNEPYDLILALSAVDEALVRAPSSPVSRFNRALTLSKLHLARRARSAWQSYLAVDQHSRRREVARAYWFSLARTDPAREWAIGRRRLNEAVQRDDENLVRSIVRQFAQNSRTYAEEELFPGWANAVRTGDQPEVLRTKKLLRAIGDSLVAETGDPTIAEAADAIANGQPKELATFVKGHLQYERGISAYQSRRLQIAKPLLLDAERAFAKGGTPFRDLALFYLLIIKYHEKDYAAAAELADVLSQHAATGSYLYLNGRTHWLLGLIEHERGHPAKAIEYLNHAVHLFERARETASLSFVHSLLADAFDYMGEPREAWRHRYLSLIGILETGEVRRLPVVLGGAALAASKVGRHSVALAFQDEAVDAATAWGDALAMSEAYWWRGIIHQRAGKLEKAAHDLALARSHCFRIPDEGIRLHTLAGIEALEGAIQRFDKPGIAIELLSSTLNYYSERKIRLTMLELYLHRGQAFAAADNLNRARSDFRAGVAEYEWQRQRISDIKLRLTYFEQAQQVFDELVNLEVKNEGGVESAFDVAERAKARVLWDALGSLYRQKEPATSLEVRRLLAPGTMLVSYYVLDKEILAWGLRREGLKEVRIPVSRMELQKKVGSLRKALITGDDHRTRHFAGSLYQDLVGSLDGMLMGVRRLVFIPDKELHLLPFSALMHSRSQRFLVQDYTISVSPSASAFLWATARTNARVRRRRVTALAIGDPAFCVEKHKDLSRLPWAESEARQAFSLFPGSVLLVGKAATLTRFSEQIDRHDLIAYSGHVQANLKIPFLSKLLLAHAKGEEKLGEVSAREIYGLRLRRPLLVVLSACGTARSAEENLEGGTDLARSFLAAGVPAVLATMWNVGDKDAGGLLHHFYGQLANGQDAVSALRAAQLRQLSRTRSGQQNSNAWASFQIFGAAPQFESAQGRDAVVPH